MSTIPKRFSVSALRDNLDQVLDRIIESGRPIEIERKGRVLRIEPVEREDRLARLRPHPEAVRDKLESLMHVDWSDA